MTTGGDAAVQNFENAIREAFTFLTDEFGFVRVSSTVRTPEHRIFFENATTRVLVAYELGGIPWVELGKLPAPGERGERYDLLFLLMERAPHEIGRITARTREIDQALPTLGYLAGLLREYGADILRGDFAIFPRLRVRAEENLTRTNEQLYGKANS